MTYQLRGDFSGLAVKIMKRGTGKLPPSLELRECRSACFKFSFHLFLEIKFARRLVLKLFPSWGIFLSSYVPNAANHFSLTYFLFSLCRVDPLPMLDYGLDPIIS